MLQFLIIVNNCLPKLWKRIVVTVMFFYAIIYGEIVRYNFLEVLFSCACMFMNVISVIQTEFPSQAKAANTVVLKIK